MTTQVQKLYPFDLTPDEFSEGVKTTPDAVLLDVRTPEEYGSGHLPGALNININGHDFHEQVENLDTEKSYYVYCRSGGRSAMACKFMQGQGFREVHNLAGGILAWQGQLES